MDSSSYDNLKVSGGKLITELKVLELKAELEARGLNKYGSKRELLERLRAYLVNYNQQQDRISIARPNSAFIEVANPTLHQGVNLENDFIREYLQNQKALFRQQIGDSPTTGNCAESNGCLVPVSLVPPTSSLPSLLPSTQPSITQLHQPKKRGRKRKHPLPDNQSQLLASSPHGSAAAPQCVPFHAGGVNIASAVPQTGVVISSRPCRSSAKTSRALSKVSLEDDDDGSSSTPATPPAQASPKPKKRHLSSRKPLHSDKDEELKFSGQSNFFRETLPQMNALTIKISRDETLIADQHHQRHHKSHKKHKKKSKSVEKHKKLSIPSLKICLPSESRDVFTSPDEDSNDDSEPSSDVVPNTSFSGKDAAKTFVKGITCIADASEVQPLRVSPCSASPQNSEVSSSIQDVSTSDHLIAHGSGYVTPPKLTTESLLQDRQASPQSSLVSEKHFSPPPISPLAPATNICSQWQKSKRMIADRSEIATKRYAARDKSVFSASSDLPHKGSVCFMFEMHQAAAEQHSPDTSDRSNHAAHQEANIEKMKQEKLRMERERLQKESDEKAKHEKLRLEKEAKEKLQKMRELQQERIKSETEKAEKERLEKLKLQNERQEQLRLEKERLETLRLDIEKKDKLRLEKEKEISFEKQKREQTRLENERKEKLRFEKEQDILRAEREKEEKEKYEKERSDELKRELEHKNQLILEEKRRDEQQRIELERLRFDKEKMEREKAEIVERVPHISMSKDDACNSGNNRAQNLPTGRVGMDVKQLKVKSTSELIKAKTKHGKNKREQELARRREELERKLQQNEQELGLRPSLKSVGPTSLEKTVLGGKPKKQRLGKGSKAVEESAIKHVAVSAAWSAGTAVLPTSPQIIEGGLPLQHVVQRPCTNDLIVSQVTCSLTDENVPSHSRMSISPAVSFFPQDTDIGKSTAVACGSFTLDAFKSPDHSSLVSLTPVSQDAQLLLSHVDISCEIPISESNSSSHLSAFVNLPRTDIAVPAMATSTSFAPVQQCLETAICTSQVSSYDPGEVDAYASDKGDPYFGVKSPPVTSAASREERKSEEVDPQLASEVQDATYYLVKELQEQDSDYGELRRRSADEPPSSVVFTSDCSSTTIYSGVLTSPPLTPQLLSPIRAQLEMHSPVTSFPSPNTTRNVVSVASSIPTESFSTTSDVAVGLGIISSPQGKVYDYVMEGSQQQIDPLSVLVTTVCNPTSELLERPTIPEMPLISFASSGSMSQVTSCDTVSVSSEQLRTVSQPVESGSVGSVGEMSFAEAKKISDADVPSSLTCLKSSDGSVKRTLFVKSLEKLTGSSPVKDESKKESCVVYKMAASLSMPSNQCSLSGIQVKPLSCLMKNSKLDSLDNKLKPAETVEIPPVCLQAALPSTFVKKPDIIETAVRQENVVPSHTNPDAKAVIAFEGESKTSLFEQSNVRKVDSVATKSNISVTFATSDFETLPAPGSDSKISIESKGVNADLLNSSKKASCSSAQVFVTESVREKQVRLTASEKVAANMSVSSVAKPLLTLSVLSSTSTSNQPNSELLMLSKSFSDSVVRSKSLSDETAKSVTEAASTLAVPSGAFVSKSDRKGINVTTSTVSEQVYSMFVSKLRSTLPAASFGALNSVNPSVTVKAPVSSVIGSTIVAVKNSDTIVQSNLISENHHLSTTCSSKETSSLPVHSLEKLSTEATIDVANKSEGKNSESLVLSLKSVGDTKMHDALIEKLHSSKKEIENKAHESVTNECFDSFKEASTSDNTVTPFIDIYKMAHSFSENSAKVSADIGKGKDNYPPVSQPSIHRKSLSGFSVADLLQLSSSEDSSSPMNSELQADMSSVALKVFDIPLPSTVQSVAKTDDGEDAIKSVLQLPFGISDVADIPLPPAVEKVEPDVFIDSEKENSQKAVNISSQNNDKRPRGVSAASSISYRRYSHEKDLISESLVAARDLQFPAATVNTSTLQKEVQSVGASVTHSLLPYGQNLIEDSRQDVTLTNVVCIESSFSTSEAKRNDSPPVYNALSVSEATGSPGADKNDSDNTTCNEDYVGSNLCTDSFSSTGSISILDNKNVNESVSVKSNKKYNIDSVKSKIEATEQLPPITGSSSLKSVLVQSRVVSSMSCPSSVAKLSSSSHSRWDLKPSLTEHPVQFQDILSDQSSGNSAELVTESSEAAVVKRKQSPYHDCSKQLVNFQALAGMNTEEKLDEKCKKINDELTVRECKEQNICDLKHKVDSLKEDVQVSIVGKSLLGWHQQDQSSARQSFEDNHKIVAVEEGYFDHLQPNNGSSSPSFEKQEFSDDDTMPRISKKRSVSTVAADAVNTTPTTRRSSRRSKVTEEHLVVTTLETREDEKQLHKTDGDAVDQGAKTTSTHVKENGASCDGEAQQADENVKCTPKRVRGGSRSNSVEKEALPVARRRSRRLSRGSSIEPSDDEQQDAERPASTALHTITEASETPERKPVAVADVDQIPVVAAEITSAAVNPVAAEIVPVTAATSNPDVPSSDAKKPVAVIVAGSGDSVSAAAEETELAETDSESVIKREETVRDEITSSVVNEKKQDADATKEGSKSNFNQVDKERKSTEFEIKDEEEADLVHSGTLRLTVETSDIHFNDSDEEDMSSKHKSGGKSKSSKSAHSSRQRTRRASDDASSAQRSQSPSTSRSRHKNRSKDSSDRLKDKERNNKKQSQRDADNSSLASHCSLSNRDKQSSSPDKRAKDKQGNESEQKLKRSPIVLTGMCDRAHADLPQSCEREKKPDDRTLDAGDNVDKSRPEAEDFDYSSFKSSRRVSLSKKSRESAGQSNTNDKTKLPVRLASQKEEPNIEISSQSLEALIPGVKPLDESELKLVATSDEEEDKIVIKSDERQKTTKSKDGDELEEGEAASLGSLSDGELRERKKLIQQKLKGLEEKERQERNDKKSESKGKRTKQTNDVSDERKVLSDDEDEQALRRAAQLSMKDKLARKEELKRRLSQEEVKTSNKERKVSANMPPTKKSKTEERMVVEGPTVPVTTRKGPYIPVARNPKSCVVIIRNLTRPFTLRQLQSLLQRTGRIVQGGFWVDNIKSVCIAKFENEDQAEETRMHLHGIQWPSSNPKTLFVDFTTETELQCRLEEFGPSLPPPQEQDRRKTLGATIVREWDRVKLGERSPGEREREMERRRLRQQQEEEEERMAGSEGVIVDTGEGMDRHYHHRRHENEPQRVVKKEPVPERPQPKSLDDLFFKTKAKPSIYWLPLNKEQIAEKEALRRKLMAENEKQMAALKEKQEEERKEREKQRLEREKQREAARERERAAREKERAAAAAKRRSRSRSRKRSPRRSPKRSSRSRRSSSRDRNRRRSRSRSRS